MEFTATAIDHLPEDSECLIVGIFAEGKLSPLAQTLDQKSKGAISAWLQQGDFTGKLNETYLLYSVTGISAKRLLLVGCGKEPTEKTHMSVQEYFKLLRTIANQLKQTQVKQAIYALPSLFIDKNEQSKAAWQLQWAIFYMRDELYCFTELKGKSEIKPIPLHHLSFLINPDDLTAATQALKIGLILSDNVRRTRDLAYLPANICTPAYLAEQALNAAKEIPSLQVEILEEKQMHELKMGALLAVTQGSQYPAKFVILRYQGAKNKDEKPIVFIGKGITFDTGGISLKPSAGIAGMKFDMCGAASVLGTLRTAAELALPLNVIGIMVCVENMIGSLAYRPDDVITSMSGQTIEVTNTDAEGRLILCDALTYASRFEPAIVIDIATLTGAIITALGKHASGIFSVDQKLVNALIKAGESSGDRAWPLPLWEDYQPQLDSVVADMVNSASGGGANSITAACFLSRFAKGYTWAHMDVAGTAFQTAPKGNATGRPVPLLVQYLLDQC